MNSAIAAHTSFFQTIPHLEPMSGENIWALRLFLSKLRHAGVFPVCSLSVLPQLLQRRGSCGGRSIQSGGHPHPYTHQPHPRTGLPAGVEFGCGLQ